MNEQEYAQWMALYIEATGFTGANEERLNELLAANRKVFGDIGATYGELCECADRLVGKAAVPKWPNEHTNALIGELREMRAEEAKRRNAGTYGQGNYQFRHDPGCDCPDCNGGEILPSYEAKRVDLDNARAKLRKYIVANGGTLLDKDGPKTRRRKK